MTKHALKITKILTLVLAIIPILIFLAFAAAISLIDFNQYKPQIEQEVSAVTNRTLKIEGAVDVSLMPFTFHIGEFYLHHPLGFEGADEDHFASAKEANIELSLKQLLLEKKLAITALEIIEPEVNFIEQADKNNWSGMPLLAEAMAAYQTMPIQSKPALTLAEPLSSSAKSVAAFNPSELFFANVGIANAQANQAGTDDPSKATAPIQVPDVVVTNSDKTWFLESLVVKDAVVRYQNTEQDFSVTLKRANLITFDVSEGKPFKINSDFIYQHSNSERTFDFQINAELRLAQNLSQIHMRDWNGVFRLQVPKERNLPDIRMGTTGKNLMVDVKHQQIYVKEAELSGMNSQVVTSFQGEFGANPEFQGVFKAEEINLKEWLQHLGLPAPEMKDESALTKVGGEFLFNWDGFTLELDSIDARVDESRIQGRLSLPLAKKQLQAQLQISDFNADKYVAQHAGQDYFPLPLDWLNRLRLQGDFKLQNFQLLGVQTALVEMTLQAQQGEYLFAPLDVNFQQGSVLSKAEIQWQPEKINVAIKGRIKDLAVTELNRGLPLSGILNSRFSLKSQGADFLQWRTNLAGNVQAELSPAKITGVDISEVLSGELRLDNKVRFTDLQAVTLLGQIENGILTPKRLQVEAEQFNATGLGTFNLATDSLQGKLMVNIKPSVNTLSALQGKQVPLYFAGNMQQLEWQLEQPVLP